MHQYDTMILVLLGQTTLSNKTKMTDSFSSTRFHMQSAYVEKAEDQPQVNIQRFMVFIVVYILHSFC